MNVDENDLLILREERGAEEIVVRVREKPPVIKYPNFMISSELVFTGPRWRNIQYLSKTHRRLLDASIFSFDLISTLAKSSAKAMQKSVGLQMSLLMFSAFILALQSIVESLLNQTSNLIGSRMYLAALYPFALLMVLWYIMTHPTNVGHTHKSTSGRWIGMHSEESAAALSSSIKLSNLRFQGLKIIDTWSEIMDPISIKPFIPVAACWSCECYLLYLTNSMMRPWAVCALTLIKLPTAVIMNTVFMRRSHSRVQWLYIVAITLMMIAIVHRELKDMTARMAASADPWAELQSRCMIYMALIAGVLTTIFSCRQAIISRFRTTNRASVQLFHVLLCMIMPNLSMGLVELILSFVHNIPLLSPVKQPLVLAFALGHMYKTYFYWSLSQQFDVIYSAATLGASWVLTFVIARAAGLSTNPFCDGASCVALTASLLGYAASKSDETKISVLKFIEKNDDPEVTSVAFIQESRRKQAAQNRTVAIKTE